MLHINPNASPNVLVPVAGLWVRVAALQEVDHRYLAWTMGLTQSEFEDAVTSWAKAEGLPYGVVLPNPTSLKYRVYQGGQLLAEHTRWFLRN